MTKEARVEFEFIEPCLIVLKIHGFFDVESATDTIQKMEDAVMGKPYFLLESDMSMIDGASPEARATVIQGLNRLPARAIAVIGGSFGQRVLGRLIIKAAVLLGKTNTVGKFFSTKEAAREWLFHYAAERDAELAEKNG